MDRSTSGRVGRRVLALAGAAAALLCGRESLAQASSIELSPGVVIHAASRTAYVMSRDSGIEAINLSSGSRRWRTDAAAKPLAVEGRWLVAQGDPSGAPNQLEIVTLDRTSGASPRAESVPLPPGVPALVQATPIGEFETFAYRATPENVVVSWEFTRYPNRGIAPEADDPSPPGGPPAPGAALTTDRVERGSVRVNLSTPSRRVSRLPGSEVVPPAPRAVQLSTAGECLAVPDSGTQYRSIDGRHVLVSQRVADDRVWEKYRWIVYDANSLQRVGETRSHLSFSPFFVSDDSPSVVSDELLVYATEPYVREGSPPEPAKLRAFRLTTGAEAWSLEIRDTEYRGSRPP